MLAFDADDAGDASAMALAPALRSFGARIERRRPVGAEDWNALLVERGAQAISASLPEGR